MTDLEIFMVLCTLFVVVVRGIREIRENGKDEEPQASKRCCGRCNGIDDLCYADMTCEVHGELGCEVCFGER